MNLLQDIKIAYQLNRNNVQVLGIFSLVFLSSMLFINNRNSVENYDKVKFSETAVPNTISYNELLGPPSLDSAVPTINGILISYSFLYKDQIIESEYFLNKRGFRNVKKLIDENSQKLKVKYNSTNPKQSIITIE